MDSSKVLDVFKDLDLDAFPKSVEATRKLPPISKMAEWHSAAAALAARGVSQTEIAGKLKKDINEISSLFRQKLFNDLVAKEIREEGNVNDFLKGLTVDSLMSVVSIRDDKTAPPQTRLAAANSLIDRALGKPMPNIKQIHTNEEGSAADPKRQLELIEKEIAREIEKSKV